VTTGYPLLNGRKEKKGSGKKNEKNTCQTKDQKTKKKQSTVQTP